MQDPYKAKVNAILGENQDEDYAAFERVKAEQNKDPLIRAHQIMVLVINSTPDEKEINKQTRQWLEDFKGYTFPNVTAAIERDRIEQLKGRFWPQPGDKPDYRGFEMICQEDGTVKITSGEPPANLRLHYESARRVMKAVNKTFSDFATACNAIDKAIRDELGPPIKRRRRK